MSVAEPVYSSTLQYAFQNGSKEHQFEILVLLAFGDVNTRNRHRPELAVACMMANVIWQIRLTCMQFSNF